MRERGIAAAHIGCGEENAAESAILAELLQWCAGIGDGGELAARRFGVGANSVPKIKEKRVRLGRRSRFAGHNEKRAREINALFESDYGCGMRAVENVQLGIPIAIAEGALK